jgi:DNA-directed RNA polymerase specialized sigma24 family protein
MKTTDLPEEPRMPEIGSGSADTPGSLTPGALTGDGVAALADAWAARILRDLGRTRPWRGGAANELDAAYWEVALALSQRTFESEEHLRRALYRGMSFRAMHFWRRAKTRAEREVPVDAVIEEVADERAEAEQRGAEMAADFRLAMDFMSELEPSERAVWTLTAAAGHSQREAAERLGLTLLDVKRHLYRVNQKRDRFVQVAENGRLCAKRSEAVSAFADMRATPEEAARARAHLAHCVSCLATYRRRRAA